MNSIYNFHKNIKELRERERLTQKQVADFLGIKYQSYQAYELGLALPSLKTFLKLGALFNVPLDDLVN